MRRSSKRARAGATILRAHWPEYLMEMAGLGAFMLSACGFGTALFHPESPLRGAAAEHRLQPVAMGVAMGLTAIAIIYSPWGRRSGAHLNPSVTLAFWRLHKIHGWDALFYVAAQFAGGILGVFVASLFLRSTVAHPDVNFVATLPRAGSSVAFATEYLMALGLMMLVLTSTNDPRLQRYTGVFAGVLIASYIALLAPLSGMSLNPARTLGSALPAHEWTGLWIYILAPPLGMLTAAEAFTRVRKHREAVCAKLVHRSPCIFKCLHGSP